MLTPVGLSATVSMHSVRSSLTRLGQQRIPDRAQEWIVGGRVFTWTPHVGARHLEALAETSLRLAWRQASGRHPDFSSTPTAFAVAALDSPRPGVVFPRRDVDLLQWADACGLGVPVHAEAVPAGACSTQIGLQRSVALLESGKAAAGVVGGVDSQLHLRTVRWHENNHRLKCSYFTDGLMPAEAACFLVVEPEDLAQQRGASIIARILSIAAAQEEATLLSDSPNTAAGLTAAVRAALQDAGVAAADVGMILSDLNGESYRAREWAFAEMRLGFQTHTELMHPADCHGDLGAATDANLLGLAALCHGTGWSDGKPILVFSGSEGGLRAATVLAPPEGDGPFLQVSKGVSRVFSINFRIPAPPDLSDDFSRSADPPRAYFEWQLREEHRDELASLYYQRNAILRDASIPWPRLREAELRMLAHLDASVASGPSSMSVVAAGVAADEEGLCFGGAFLIGTLPTGENFSLIDAALEQPTEPRLAGIAAGLMHAPDSAELQRFVRIAVDSQEPAVQAMAVGVAGARRIDIRAQLPRLVAASDVSLLKAVAGTCRRLKVEEATTGLQQLLSHDRPDVRRAAVLALLRIVPGPTAAYARSRLDANAEFDGALAVCVGIAGQLRDASMLVERIEQNPGERSLIEALGILGAPHGVPHLIWLLGSEDADVKVAAGAALDLIAGLHARERVARTESFEIAGEVVAETREVEQVNTSAAFWTAWWEKQRTRLEMNARWRLGAYFTVNSCIDELANPLSAYDARTRAWLELVTRAPVDIPFEPDWFVQRQDESIHAWRAWQANQRDR
jgi:3-oxoacyl-[acyl-carrier-protein] synthase-1